jgi:hypothetical protein
MQQKGFFFSETWKIFMGTECPACEGRKTPKHGFCGGCYWSLPRVIRHRLWRSFGHGYEEAHTAALHFLKARSVVEREKRRA